MTQTASPSSQLSLRRIMPLLILLTGLVTAYYFLGDYLSFQSLKDNREFLINWRDSNLLLAVLVYMGLYIIAVAFSVPGGIWLTITGGFLFGLGIGTGATVLAATMGATLIFLAAKTALGGVLRAKCGPWLARMEAGFTENAVSYLLVMRLVPAVPFFIANLAPAFLGTRLKTYIWTTFLGIIPGTAVYTWVGAGLGEVIEQGGVPDLGIIFSPNILGPLLGLALLSLIPIMIKKMRAKAEETNP